MIAADKLSNAGVSATEDLARHEHAAPWPLRLALFVLLLSMPFEYPERSLPVETTTIATVVLLAVALADPGRSFRYAPAAFWGWLTYFGACLYCTLASGFHYPPEQVKTLLQLAMPMAMAVVVFNLFREERLRRQALWFFAWACVIRAGIQALGIWRTELPRWGGRISALGQEPNNATAILSLGILCLIGLSIRRRDGNLLARTAAIGGMALIAIALVQLSSRGGLIALMAGICALGMSSARAALAAVSLAAILLVGGSQVESVRTRFEDTLRSGDLAGRDLLYPAQLEMFSERPLQGWGLVSNNIELGVRTAVADLSRAQRDSHSLILHVLTSTGVVGAIPLGLSIVSCVLAAWRTRRGPEGALAFALITTVLVLNLSETWIFTKLNWIVFAYAASQPELYQRSADPTETLDAGRQVRDLCTS